MPDYNQLIAAAINSVIDVEKGYVNNPDDRGGETNFGITVAVARANGYNGPMRDMPRSVAETIYRKRYIVEPRFDDALTMDARIGYELIDTGVNMGPGVAATFLQRWLNAFNYDDARYARLVPDGRIGGETLKALAAFLKWRGDEGRTVLYNALNSVQGARYLQIAENSPNQRKFVYGQMRLRVGMA